MARDKNAMPERLRERIEARERRFLDRFQGCLVGGEQTCVPTLLLVVSC